MDRSFLIKIHLTNEEIMEKRKKVREKLINSSQGIKNGAITNASIEDLKILFDAYDCYYFQNYFGDNFVGKIKFSFSKRMTRSAGLTLVPKNIASLKPYEEVYEIRMGINFFYSYYETTREKNVNGIKTKDALEAFQLVFEHELCHLIEFYVFKNSSCKKQRFRSVAKNIFGHHGVYHQLPTSSEIAKIKYGFKVGDKVWFTHENKKVDGVISSINKRATVMVPNEGGTYIDSKGNKYAKWYVPLNILK